MERKLSEALNNRALKSIVGGVNSPVRAFGAVEEGPLYIDHAKGAFIYDVDGNQYVDHLMSWGAITLGHAYPKVVAALNEATQKGTSYGLSNPTEARLAELIKDAYPSVELLRMVNSGTEAVMSAIRLARGFTVREKIIKFQGCYHGHSDGLLAGAGSGLATLGIPASGGVCPGSVESTLTAKYNDLDSVEEIARVCGEDVACIIVEPVGGNMGVIPPAEGFLQGLRVICDRIGAMLIFDEVITGFRIARGGAQERFGIKADLTTLGKIIGGGLPCGAFGGRADIMEKLAPLGDVYQAGTLSGNPLVMAAGEAVLTELYELDPYSQVEKAADELESHILKTASQRGVPVHIGRCGPMFTVFFTDSPVIDFATADAVDRKRYAKFFSAMLENGVLIAPSALEAGFMTMAHLQDETAGRAYEAIEKAFAVI